MKNLPQHGILSLLCLLLVAPISFGFGSPETLLDQEAKKRHQLAQPLEESIKASQDLARQGNVREAYESLEKAYRAVPDSIQQTSLGAKARDELARLSARLADVASQKNHWPEARRMAIVSLGYNQNCSLGREVLAKSDEVLQRGAQRGEETNPALSTKFFDHLNDVNQGLEEAKNLRETGQLDNAEKRYEAVLKLDPFNRVATEGIEKIYEERSLVAEQSRDISNLERRREVREAWNNIYPKKNNVSGGVAEINPMTASPTFALESKLRKIIIPQVDYSNADLDTIRRTLNTQSKANDPDDKRGINFIVSADLTDALPVNLKLRQATLEDVVRYVSQIARVKARINPEIGGVVFSPLVEKRPDLIPRNFTVSPAFFKDTASSDGADSSGATSLRGSGGASTTGSSLSSTNNAQKHLEAMGVVFPEGAYAIYNRNTSQLKVANNAEMLDLIGQLISAAEEQTLLIQVGCRLVEINQSDLDSLTVNSTFGGSGVNLLSPIPTGLSTNGSGGTPSGSTQQGVTAQLNQIQGVGLLPNNTLSSFLQSGVLAGTNQTSSYALNTLNLGGTIFNGMQYRTFISAISQKNSANVLANPSITLKRGQKGVIEVSQEFRYVKEYNDPQSSIRTINPPPLAVQGQGGFSVSTTTSVPGPETVISSFPSQISDPVPIGIKMDVKPDVTGDNSRVLLEIRPSFIDFEGFINYGTVINSSYAASYFQTTVTILTNNIQQPVFIRRDVTLEPVEVNDGYTLLLGGLLREDIQKIDEKVPLIGDIPLLGRAFQGKTEQAFKKNTLIFVTPRILTVDGQPLNPTAGASTTASSGP